MTSVYKLLLIIFFVFLIAFAGYKAYLYLNNKIIGSKTGWELLGFTLLLFSINVLLLFGGMYVLIELYVFLSGE